MAKTWKESDLDYLRRYAQAKTLKQLMQRFGAGEAELTAKLTELDLATKDGRPGAGRADPVLGIYEQGLRDLHAGKWQQAVKSFEKVAAESDQPELAERARQFLATCARRQAAAGAGAAAKTDPYLEAVVAKNRGDLKRALEISCEGGRSKRDERFAFLAAGIYALEEREDEAVQALRLAVELNPKNRVHAFHDPDFASLRGKPEHAHLFGLA